MIDSKSAAKPPIRFIEFLGLPGAGKTTIAAHLEVLLEQHGIGTVSRSVVLADKSPFLWRQFKRSIIIARNIHRCWKLDFLALKVVLMSGQKSLKDLCKVTWNIWSVLAFIADCRRKCIEVAIIDQGLLQSIWSIKLNSSKAPPQCLYAELLLVVGLKDIFFVHVRSEIQIALRRVSTRETKETRMPANPQGNLTALWKTAAADITGLTELLHEVASEDDIESRFLTVENNFGAPDVAAAEVASTFLMRNNYRRTDHSSARLLQFSR